jgi:hypothetical protein
VRLVQVVPHFAPESEGVSALAAGLNEELRRSRVEVGDPIALGSSSPAAEAELASVATDPQCRLLLHYSGYGYHPRGAPQRLAELWEEMAQKSDRRRLGVLFHEVAAIGPPWRSSFWLAPRQRSIARRLLAASGVAVTSLDRYRSMLRSLSPQPAVELLPIPSTVGEPTSVPEYTERSAQLVVFGSRGVRERAYRRALDALRQTVRALEIEQVVDIGAGDVAPATIGSASVMARGQTPRAEVSRHLLTARAGFLAYPPDYLDKSTIYGAYLAHGLVPVCAWGGPRGRSPREDEAWVRATPSRIEGDTSFDRVARRAHQEYAGRSIVRHAELWRARLFPA